MSSFPAPIQNLINAFSRLPGIGPRTASRLTFYLLRAADSTTLELADALTQLKTSTGVCKECFNITLADHDLCDICEDSRRDQDTICVVEEPIDVIVIEQSGGYFGKYHVLNGVLSPINGVNPEDIKIDALITRVANEGIKEVIIATNPSVEGDATALYIQKKLKPYNVRVTRLARGLPSGSDIEYADQNTMLRALAGRQEL